MGSVRRERSWKTCSLGSLGYTTPHPEDNRAAESAVQRKKIKFGLKYCSTFQSGVLPQRSWTQPYSPSSTAVVNNCSKSTDTNQLLQNICQYRNLTASSVPLPRHTPKRCTYARKAWTAALQFTRR